MTRPIKFAINGFGRIGRAITRQWIQGGMASGFELVAVNDIAPLDTCSYLLEFDSIYGPVQGTVVQTDTGLDLNGRGVRFTQCTSLDQVDLSDVDIVFECTGKVTTDDWAQAGLRAGARRVLVSGPSPMADVTIVEGANHECLDDQIVVSNASCTTNALAPLLRVLDEAYGLGSGHMTTIHCYTGSQPTVDAPRGNSLERNRAAAMSMVPTTTSAMRLIDDVLPHLAGRIAGCAVRVPTASVSAIDLTCHLRDIPDRDDLNACIAAALPTIIGTTNRPLVSSDLRARCESLILATAETKVIQDGLVRVFGWYDNEWGFSARMFDVARRMLRADMA